MIDSNMRHLCCARQQVVGISRCQRLRRAVVGHFFKQCGADTLHRATDGLAIDHHRINQRAAVFANHVVKQLDDAGVDIDFDQRAVAGETEHAGVHCRLVVFGRLQPAQMHTGGQTLRAMKPGRADFCQRCSAFVATKRAVRQGQRCLTAPRQMRCNRAQTFHQYRTGL